MRSLDASIGQPSASPASFSADDEANPRISVASGDAAEDLPIFDRVAQWPHAYKSYLAEGYAHDCALGDRMVGGPGAPLARRMAGYVGKAGVVVVGGISRAVGLAKLAQWAARAVLGFARWVVSGCVSFARFLGGIVATEVVEKAIGPRNQVQQAMANITAQTDRLASDPTAQTEHQNGAQLAQAYLRGTLGRHFGEKLREAYKSDPFQQAMSDAQQDARRVVVEQVERAVEDAKPYVFIGLTAGVVGAAAALYSGNVNEIASTIVVGGSVATVAAAGFYSVSASLSEAADSVAAWIGNAIFPMPDDED
ncbi:hypothetical protein ACUSIJ_19805 [Pseudochelatococcus sp. B33]